MASLSSPSKAVLALALLAAAGAHAQVLVDQSAALAGGVSAGDGPGFPITISRSGHYRLTSDLVVPMFTPGIVVTASDVVIDLDGHTLSSGVECAQSITTGALQCNVTSPPGPHHHDRAGIRTIGANLVVRNGTVRGFAGFGIANAKVVEDMRVLSNAGSGLRLAAVAHFPADTSHVRRSFLERNGGSGAEGAFALIESSVVRGNGGHGLFLSGSTVRGSVVSYNMLRGINAGAAPTTSVRGTDLAGNQAGAVAGGVISLGGNSNGLGAF